ncbi:endolytic transglycosylase MltG [Mycolicibacterium sp.]|uniref:endolytic transglycosylase MltG n=1 Tax=Mycolicibacterium sp. TaxID=2320850 RepID=UPI0028AC6E99|nr:endolytic transglycosylase MltG [Mycolicibacterium sp.]
MPDDVKPEDVQPGRAEPVAVGARRQTVEAHKAGNRRNGRIAILIGLALAAALAVWLLGPKLFGSAPKMPSDFTGEGKQDIVVEVHPGDSGSVIAQDLVDKGVIADVGMFISAASGNSELAAIQPGFYMLRTEIPAATAVKKLTDPKSRVGKLVIPEGKQLDDITPIGAGSVNPGIFSLISDASCVNLNGTKKCVSAADLKAAAEDGTLESLNAPEWALKGAGAMGQSHRRLEGLIAPGTWNINPSSAPKEILAKLVAESGEQYAKSGILDAAKALNISPYEVLIVGSLVQKEAQPADFAKVARVIYNRLASDYDRLEFDSTVNYPLERQEVATTDEDRAAETPWNTYAMPGLPATPICSPSVDALAAAERPEPGDWLYFVTIDSDGTTLFTSDYQEHLANRDKALDSGFLNSGR